MSIHSIKDYDSLAVELSFNEIQQVFELQITKATDSKVVFELSNNCEELRFMIEFASDKVEIEAGESLNFSSERDIKELFQKTNWQIKLNLLSDLNQILEPNSHLMVDLNPTLLLD